MENILTQRPDPIKTRENIASQIRQYLQDRVMPILSPLQVEIIKKRPDSIQTFCLEFLKKNKYAESEQIAMDQAQNDEIIPESIFREQVRRKLKNRRNSSRKGIIGDRPKEGFLTVGYQYLSTPGKEWPEQVTVSLLMHLKKCVFFQHLPTNDLLKLIQRMRAVIFNPGDMIIKQGESGNQLYIVDSGVLKCKKEDSEEVLKIYGKGQIFGQLSLLYNNPRASTVTAIEGGRLFALARPQFAAILHVGMVDKLRQCEQLVNKVSIFDSLSLYQRSKLFESMQLKVVGPERYIIRQGQNGNCFYIVAEGHLAAYKQRNNENKLVYAYKRGDYFGQIALLKHLPRQASVKTVTDVRLYFINAECFSRVLGPLENILKRNQERYIKFTSELGN